MNNIYCLVNENITCDEVILGFLKNEVDLELLEKDGKIRYLETRVNQLESLIASIIKTSMEHIIVDIVID